MADTLASKVIKGSLWQVGGQVVSMSVGLATNIILTRLLDPYAFGVYGIIMFFVTLSNIFIDSGFSGALVRKSSVSREDYSTLLFLNLGIGVVLSLLLILMSTPISIFYDKPDLKVLVCAVSPILVVNALQVMQVAELTISLNFKRLNLYSILSGVFGSVAGIVSALSDLGVWSLVIWQYTKSSTMCLALWCTTSTRVLPRLSKDSFRTLFGFGMNTASSSIIAVVFNNIYQLTIAKIFTIAQSGIYYQAKQLETAIEAVATSVNQSVFFSTLSKVLWHQGAEEYIKKSLLLLMGLLFVIGGGLLNIFLFSDEIISLLYGSQWAKGGYYLKFISVYGYFYIIENFLRVRYKLFDKTKLLLRLEIPKRTIESILIIVALVTSNITVLLTIMIISSISACVISFVALLSSNIVFSVDEIKLIVCHFSVMAATSVLSILFFKYCDNISITYVFSYIGPSVIYSLICFYALYKPIRKTAG